MVEALEGDYPAVAHFLGAEGFADLVTRYVQAHPSVSYTFNRLGARFPEFVRASRGIRARLFAADLARLELLVTEVFDSPESPAWPAEEVARVPQEAWAAARLEPIAAFRLGAFGYPVNAYLQSVKDENHDHPGTARQDTWTAVWRKNYEVWRLNLSKPQFEFLKALAKGRPFGKPYPTPPGGSRARPANNSSGGCATGSPRGCSPDWSRSGSRFPARSAQPYNPARMPFEWKSAAGRGVFSVFGDLERRVLEALWERSESVCVRELCAKFPLRVHDADATLDRLCRKGVWNG